ncbi:MAG TPA: peptidoglycan-associated lipoprotein Pal, partial [Deltaproteobacteria bacterium]|nr:peptidoglycan-associated lipoprotein Pal [Deltaproteobacteria bacterium]
PKKTKAPPKEAVTIIAAPVEEIAEPIPEMGIIYFDYDKSNIRSEFEGVILTNLDWVINNPEIRIQLEGHCDERGTNEYNLALGERRARSVLNYLLRHGANPDRFSIVSFGEERPVALGHNESSWQKNRRVEFTRL